MTASAAPFNLTVLLAPVVVLGVFLLPQSLWSEPARQATANPLGLSLGLAMLLLCCQKQAWWGWYLLVPFSCAGWFIGQDISEAVMMLWPWLLFCSALGVNGSSRIFLLMLLVADLISLWYTPFFFGESQVWNLSPLSLIHGEVSSSWWGLLPWAMICAGSHLSSWRKKP